MSLDEMIVVAVKALACGIILAAGLLVNGWVWRKVWSVRGDWFIFTSYIHWKWRHKDRFFKDRRTVVEMMRMFAAELENMEEPKIEPRSQSQEGGAA